MIDPRSDRALYRQLADLLRDKILSGEYPPGSQLPSEVTLGQEYGLARPAVRQAIAILRGEALVTTERGYGTQVREQVDRADVKLPAGASAICRAPYEPERVRLDLDEGVPVIEVRHKDGRAEIHPGDRVRIVR
jgi:DNA-binding GntR family transcriptional regulator